MCRAEEWFHDRSLRERGARVHRALRARRPRPSDRLGNAARVDGCAYPVMRRSSAAYRASRLLLLRLTGRDGEGAWPTRKRIGRDIQRAARRSSIHTWTIRQARSASGPSPGRPTTGPSPPGRWPATSGCSRHRAGPRALVPIRPRRRTADRFGLRSGSLSGPFAAAAEAAGPVKLPPRSPRPARPESIGYEPPCARGGPTSRWSGGRRCSIEPPPLNAGLMRRSNDTCSAAPACLSLVALRDFTGGRSSQLERRAARRALRDRQRKVHHVRAHRVHRHL